MFSKVRLGKEPVANWDNGAWFFTDQTPFMSSINNVKGLIITQSNDSNQKYLLTIVTVSQSTKLTPET